MYMSVLFIALVPKCSVITRIKEIVWWYLYLIPNAKNININNTKY